MPTPSAWSGNRFLRFLVVEEWKGLRHGSLVEVRRQQQAALRIWDPAGKMREGRVSSCVEDSGRRNSPLLRRGFPRLPSPCRKGLNNIQVVRDVYLVTFVIPAGWLGEALVARALHQIEIYRAHQPCSSIRLNPLECFLRHCVQRSQKCKVRWHQREVKRTSTSRKL